MKMITNENIREFVVDGSWNISGSMKPDNGSTEIKKFILDVNFVNEPVVNVIQKALEAVKVQWANGGRTGRNNFEAYANNQVVKIDFKSPARAPQLSPMEQFRIDAKEAGVDVNDKVALTKYITEQLNKAI